MAGEKWHSESVLSAAQSARQDPLGGPVREARPLEAMMNRVSSAVSNLDSALCAFEERVGPIMACPGPEELRKAQEEKGQSILFEQLASLAHRIEDLGDRIREDIRRVEL